MGSSKARLDPWYVSGFVDGEGCFTLFINTENRKRNRFTSVYRYWVVDFSIHLREDDGEILVAIRDFFDAGRVNEIPAYHSVHYNIRDRQDIVGRLIPHFDRFPLQAKKGKDFLLWREAVVILEAAKKRQTNRFVGQCLEESEEKRLYEIKDALSQRLRGQPRGDYLTRRGILRTGKQRSK